MRIMFVTYALHATYVMQCKVCNIREVMYTCMSARMHVCNVCNVCNVCSAYNVCIMYNVCMQCNEMQGKVP